MSCSLVARLPFVGLRKVGWGQDYIELLPEVYINVYAINSSYSSSLYSHNRPTFKQLDLHLRVLVEASF